MKPLSEYREFSITNELQFPKLLDTIYKILWIQKKINL